MFNGIAINQNIAKFKILQAKGRDSALAENALKLNWLHSALQYAIPANIKTSRDEAQPANSPMIIEIETMAVHKKQHICHQECCPNRTRSSKSKQTTRGPSCCGEGGHRSEEDSCYLREVLGKDLITACFETMVVCGSMTENEPNA